MRKIKTCLILLILVITCTSCAPRAFSESFAFSRDDIPMIHNMEELKEYVEEQLQFG